MFSDKLEYRINVSYSRANDTYLLSIHQNGRDKRTDAVDRMTQQATAVPNGDPIVQTTGVMVQFRQVLSN